MAHETCRRHDAQEDKKMSGEAPDRAQFYEYEGRAADLYGHERLRDFMSASREVMIFPQIVLGCLRVSLLDDRQVAPHVPPEPLPEDREDRGVMVGIAEPFYSSPPSTGYWMARSIQQGRSERAAMSRVQAQQTGRRTRESRSLYASKTRQSSSAEI